MGQTGRRSIATHILAVKIALAAAHFHGFGVARQGPWDTRVNSGRNSVFGDASGSIARLPAWAQLSISLAFALATFAFVYGLYSLALGA
jgi:hypothetical protein